MTYDEFSFFAENASEAGLAYDGPPIVRRVSVPVDGDRRLSALVWGEGVPEYVLLHGGGQNAHTWDTVALALDRPLVAIDLPGHGHSDWREDGRLFPTDNAISLRLAVEALAPDARAVVGMSLGGLSTIALGALVPELVRRMLLVDVSPAVDRERASPIVAFLAGPEDFGSFDEILERTIAFNPTRSEASLRRGVLHNARAREDGRWEWRYQRMIPDTDELPDFAGLWDDLGAYSGPVLLARGGDSPVVTDDDVTEFVRRQPEAEIVVVEGAGHSIQGDRPLELAGIVERFADTTG
jgi:pimeloyl-ACP methyl ester carboxylesterase